MAVALSGCNLRFDDDVYAEVTEWEAVSIRSVRLTVSFEEQAPKRGCSIEALTSDSRSIGYVIAKPENGDTQRVLMTLDRGNSSEVADVVVADCGT